MSMTHYYLIYLKNIYDIFFKILIYIIEFNLLFNVDKYIII